MRNVISHTRIRFFLVFSSEYSEYNEHNYLINKELALNCLWGLSLLIFTMKKAQTISDMCCEILKTCNVILRNVKPVWII